MTTIQYPDITHKKPVLARYNPNSYRILSEDIPEHESIPSWYGHNRPPSLHTAPCKTRIPTQTSEPRNNPHAGRKVDMIYTNVACLNAPVGVIKTDCVLKEESRWWDWSSPKSELYGPAAQCQDQWSKTRESSYRNAYGFSGTIGPYAKKNSRYSSTPYHTQTVGIVPVTDLKPEDFHSASQVHEEKVSFDHYYNCRTAANYPLRGRRQGAFVIKDAKPPPKPVERNHTNTSSKLERMATVWDLFHPNDAARPSLPKNLLKHQRSLPRTKQTERSDCVWQNAPYAPDVQID